jgi:hypothetical protein
VRLTTARRRKVSPLRRLHRYGPPSLCYFCVVALAACDALTGSSADIAGSYFLVSGAKVLGATVEFTRGGDFGARPVCNNVSGTHPRPATASTSDVRGTTFAHCGDGMGVEIAFNDASESSERYFVAGERLNVIQVGVVFPA